MKQAGVDASRRMISEGLRHRLQKDLLVGKLIDALSFLPGLAKEIEAELPDAVVQLATKALAPEVRGVLSPEACEGSRSFQHFFLCEGDYARSFQEASAHLNLEMDATFVSEELVGYPFHLFLATHKG